MISTLAALATVIAGIIGIYTFVRDPAPSVQAGDLREIVIVSNETYGDYVDRVQARPEESLATLAPNFTPPAEAERSQPGVTLAFEVLITGYRAEPCTIRWSMFDAETRELLDDPVFVNQFGFPEKSITAHSESDDRDVEIWAPVPRTAGRYYIQVTLIDPDGRRLDSILSEAFDVRASEAPLPTPLPPTPSSPATPPVIRPPLLATSEGT